MIGECENFGMAEITAIDAFPYKRLLRKGIFFVPAESSATARFGCWYVLTALLPVGHNLFPAAAGDIPAHADHHQVPEFFRQLKDNDLCGEQGHYGKSCQE
jgi:hypothetical protein